MRRTLGGCTLSTIIFPSCLASSQNSCENSQMDRRTDWQTDRQMKALKISRFRETLLRTNFLSQNSGWILYASHSGSENGKGKIKKISTNKSSLPCSYFCCQITLLVGIMSFWKDISYSQLMECFALLNICTNCIKLFQNSNDVIWVLCVSYYTRISLLFLFLNDLPCLIPSTKFPTYLFPLL